MLDRMLFLRQENAYLGEAWLNHLQDRQGANPEPENIVTVPDVLRLLTKKRLKKDRFAERFHEAKMSYQGLREAYEKYSDLVRLSILRTKSEVVPIRAEIEKWLQEAVLHDAPPQNVDNHIADRFLAMPASDDYRPTVDALCEAGGERLLWWGHSEGVEKLFVLLYQMYCSSGPMPIGFEYSLSLMEQGFVLHDAKARTALSQLADSPQRPTVEQMTEEDEQRVPKDLDLQHRRYEISLKKVESLHKHLSKNIGRELNRRSIADELGLSAKAVSVSHGLNVLRDWGSAEIESRSRGIVCLKAADMEKIRDRYRQKKCESRKKSAT